jgi:excisionase family DNA binding protein
MSTPLLSPKQVARAIGVSESSLKRWCDRGTIATVKTAGGHRRIPLADILAFLRETGHPIVQPEVLGLPASIGAGERTWRRSQERLVEALVAGDELLARQIVFDLYLARHPISEIGDQLLNPALREIGRRWECGDAEVYQERRACEICNRVLLEFRSLLPEPSATAPLAIGGAPAGDQYRLPTLLVELALRERGWRAVSLGSNLPFDTLVAAVERYQPRLFWLSVSFVADESTFCQEYAKFYEALTSRPAVVTGGRALHESLRQQLTYAAHCDNLRHPIAFVDSLGITPAKAHRPGAA